jgi:hypothetical protein
VIHLWIDGEEKWKAFELSTAAEELKKRGIQIGEGVYLGDSVRI